MQGPLWVIIWDVNQAGDCYGVKLVAEGWGEMQVTDNDIFGVGPEGNNANARRHQAGARAGVHSRKFVVNTY